MATKKDAIYMLDQLCSMIGKDFSNKDVQHIYSETIHTLESLPDEENEFLLELLENKYIKAREGKISILICAPICEALANRKERRAVPILCRILVDPISIGIREDISEILGELGDPSAVSFLLQVLNDKEVGVRAKAATSLGKLANHDVIKPLISLLEDESDTVREHAIEALTQLKAKEAAPAIINILDVDEDIYVRGKAVWALGELEIKSATQIIKRIIERETDGEFVNLAKKALDKL